MSEERLNSIAATVINNDLIADENDVFNRFVHKATRKVDFIDLD